MTNYDAHAEEFKLKLLGGKTMKTLRNICWILVLLGLTQLAFAQIVQIVPETNAKRAESDAEPLDPAEYRVQKAPPILSELEPSRIVDAGGIWTSSGPAPTRSGQVRMPDNEACGAINSIAPHPTNADILYIGAINGGVWRTNNATAARPTWTPLTDFLPSQSIGSVVFDPTDATRQTILVGTGRRSNFAQRGDDEIGVYRSVNGGTTWSQLGGATLLGQKLISVVARGSTLFAASFTGGLYRSVDTGANWTLISGTNGLPTGGIDTLSESRLSPNRLVIGVRGTTPKFLRSDDLGASWTNISTGITNLGSASSLRITAGSASVLFATVVNAGILNGVYRSANLGASWTALDVVGVHAGAQGALNTALIADLNNPNVVYLSGDRIPAGPFTGIVARIDASLALGSQITFVVDDGANKTAPHADTRAMAFDANGNLLESDDGGIYRLSNPSASTRIWGSVIGNLNVMEVHNVAKDSITNVLIVGTQDNGTQQQAAANDLRWEQINGGDGGDVAVDSTTLGPSGSFRYLSSQNLQDFRRDQYSATNAFVNGFYIGSINDPQFVTPFEPNSVNPGRLLVGGQSTLYEVTTEAPWLNFLGGPGANRQAIAFGATNDPEAIYIGVSNQVWKRSGASGGTMPTTAFPAGTFTITDVAMDPTNSNRVFAIDDHQIFASTDGGVIWTNVTGNLGAISSQDFRTVEYISDAGGDSVAIGTRSGVYLAPAFSALWGRLGSALPDVLVFDLRYYKSQKTLIAGTLGRGVWTYEFPGEQLLRDGFE